MRPRGVIGRQGGGTSSKVAKVLILLLGGLILGEPGAFAQATKKPATDTQVFLCNKPGQRPNNDLTLLEFEGRVLLVTTSARLKIPEGYFSCAWGNRGTLFQKVSCQTTLPSSKTTWELSVEYNKIGNKRSLNGLSLIPDQPVAGAGPLHLGSYSCEIARPTTERGRSE